MGECLLNCKICGAALPSHGFICKNCGAMMDSEQIKMQKKFINENKKNNEVILKSDLFSKEPINRNYNKESSNKILGAVLIILVLIILIIIAILKVM